MSVSFTLQPCKLMDELFLVPGVYLLCLEIALLAGQLLKVNDGNNDRCLLPSVMVDWTGGLYRLTFLLLLLLLLAQMETDATRSAMFLVKAPRLLGLLLLAQCDDGALCPSSEQL